MCAIQHGARKLAHVGLDEPNGCPEGEHRWPARTTAILGSLSLISRKLCDNSCMAQKVQTTITASSVAVVR
jgi:hypothetical protein